VASLQNNMQISSTQVGSPGAQQVKDMVFGPRKEENGDGEEDVGGANRTTSPCESSDRRQSMVILSKSSYLLTIDTLGESRGRKHPRQAPDRLAGAPTANLRDSDPGRPHPRFDSRLLKDGEEEEEGTRKRGYHEECCPVTEAWAEHYEQVCNSASIQ
jgi:hypothetical protein